MNFVQAMTRVADLKAQIKQYEEEIQDLYAGYSQTQTVGHYAAGAYIVKVSDNVRFNAATAQKNLTPEQVAQISVTRPDSATAKKVLSGDDYKKCQQNLGLKREVVKVTDEE